MLMARCQSCALRERLRQLDLLDAVAERFDELGEALADPLPRLSHTGERTKAKRGGVVAGSRAMAEQVGARGECGAGIALVVAGNGIGEERGVVDAAGEDARLCRASLGLARMPWREISPRLGLKPTTPQKEAGRITEPLVCVPMRERHHAGGHRRGRAGGRAARRVRRIVRVARLAGREEASSVVTVLPRMMAPACAQPLHDGGVVRGRRPASIGVPFSVGMSAVSMMSLMPTGTPCSGPDRPARGAQAVRRLRLRAAHARGRDAPRPAPPPRARRCGRGTPRRAPRAVIEPRASSSRACSAVRPATLGPAIAVCLFARLRSRHA